MVYLAKVGLSDDQQDPILRRRREAFAEVTFDNAELISRAMKGMPYVDVYDEFVRSRAFSVKLLDGALVQMAYAFKDDTLARHRLAYLASPYHIPFLEDLRGYLDQEEHALRQAEAALHVIEDGSYLDDDEENAPRPVTVDPVNVRFDYDSDPNRHRDVWHPKSHLTIGQYEHCRVPVSAPLTPVQFMEFVLRHFYCTETMDYVADLPRPSTSFPASISRKEEGVIHVVVPQ